MEENKIKVGFISLGCDKNRADTELVISNLSMYDCFEFVAGKDKADLIIINTCAFLASARDETGSVIKEMSKLKPTPKIIVMGCLPLYKREGLEKTYPKVSKFLVPSDYADIASIVFELFGLPRVNAQKEYTRRLTTPMHYAYLKIADGCNNRCAFCKIPYIRGPYKSVPRADLVSEATALCEKGVKEIILVAQDVTRYGQDIGDNLVALIKDLSKIKKLSWIRLLYCYPDAVTPELISEIKDNPKVLPYIDIPLQHISDNVLKSMYRRSRKEQIISLIGTLRKEIPNITIRSTFMVGFPGESKEDFEELCDFIKEYKLNNVGFFKYSREEGTPSYSFEGQIPEKEKDRRLKTIESLQEKVAEENNLALVGTTCKVLVDSFDREHKFFVGRSYRDAPDIDFEVLFTSSYAVQIGSFVDVDLLDYSQGYFIGKTDKRTTY